MCSHLLKGMMENYQGDLADIFRARTTAADGGSVVTDSWQFPSSDPITYSSSGPVQDFGDPFSYMGDPLLPNIDSPVSGFSYNSNIIKSGDGGGGISISHSVIVHDDHEMMIKRRPSDIFSRMLQISPNAKSPVSPPSDHCQPPPAAVVAAGAYPAAGFRVPPILISPSSSKGCLVESSGLQISSPRNTGIKRRKSQAKKVVCIPASSPANSRATGEIVPSDLWAWRKYGQKPIKGSPYPRGYYRCSSSKGCSARKQVERSRTDSNMLVITYTSEHNHPWPTQRNALAGSTRSQPSKNTTTNSATKTSHRDTVNPKHGDGEKENRITSFAVKEETTDRDFDNQLEMENADQFELGFSYKPSLEDGSFFADLGDIETDEPLEDLLLENPFSFCSWAATAAAAAAETTVSSAVCYAKDNREL